VFALPPHPPAQWQAKHCITVEVPTYVVDYDPVTGDVIRETLVFNNVTYCYRHKPKQPILKRKV
jgi:hypothetical protein